MREQDIAYEIETQNKSSEAEGLAVKLRDLEVTARGRPKRGRGRRE